MKKLFLLFVLLISMFSCKDKPYEEINRKLKRTLNKTSISRESVYINDLLFKKYHSIYLESKIHNKYGLHSGIRYYENEEDMFGIIEYQIPSFFENSYEECLNKALRNDIKLNKKIESYRKKLNKEYKNDQKTKK